VSTGLERGARRLTAAVARVPWLRRALLSRAVALPGYGVATACGWVWGAAIGLAPVRRHGRLLVCAGLPPRMFGRAGTTIGAVYLTADNVGERVLHHEDIHRTQWRHYGLAFVPLYVAAGSDALHNRFEIAAGLADGGYL
jgi:hypothetical protein